MTKPLISGFTIIKNGVSLGYPFIESLKSLEPLCDEIIVGVGFDDEACEQGDGTWELLNSTFKGPKFKFFKSYWNPEVSSRGLILSEQTNLALEKCSGTFCQYLQSDELLHEEEIEAIKDFARKYKDDQEIEAFAFNYYHFYGHPTVYKYTRNVYRREVRLIRNGLNLKSYLDAQGFRHLDESKPKALLSPFHIYHYGWAREQEIMNKKNKAFAKMYHGKNHEEAEFQYCREWGLKKFTQSHPQAAQSWIEKQPKNLDILSLPFKWEWKVIGLMISDFVEMLTGYRMGEFKNYRLIKRRSHD